MTTAQLSTDQMRSLWQKHQKNLNVLVVILLVIYLLAYAAELVWRLIPTPEEAAPQVAQTQVSSNASGKAQVNINAIKQLKLFGDPEVVEVVEAPVIESAPETNLNLTLTGLVASTTETDGAAIIENNGEQNTYGIGDKVDNTNAIVKEVQRDRIIINNGGRFETLMLDGHDFDEANKMAARQNQKKIPVPGPIAPKPKNRASVNRQLDRENAEMARALRTSPAKFTDFISIQPFRQAGRIAGYKVNPGREPALFKAAGLRPNDVLTEINGLDLTDVQQSMQAMNMLRTADFLQITVSRNGEVTTLDLELPESNGN